MSQNPMDDNNSTDRVVRLVKNSDAKSIFVMDSENKKVDKLEDAVEQLDDIEVLSEGLSEEDMQNLLMSNNYKSYEEEEKAPEPILDLAEEFREEKVPFYKKALAIAKDFCDRCKNLYDKMSNRMRKVLYVILALFVVLLFVMFVKYEKKIHTYRFEFIGPREVTIYEGGLYKEQGVIAYNYKGENKRGLVKINAKVDSEKIGDYQVTYTIKSFWKHNEVTRKVKVLPNPLDDIYFTLNGDDEVTVDVNKKFNDPGYNIKSKDNKDYSKYVTVTSNLDTSKIGTYEVKYLIKINKKQQELRRTVHVKGSRYTVNYSNAPTKTKVELNIVSNINNFDYFIIDEHKVLKSNVTYAVSENGRYDFTMFDTDGKMDTITVYVSNIDRTPPTGSCVAYMSSKNKKTNFKMNIKDASGISSYRYNNKNYENYNFTVNSLVKSGSVEVTDKAGNKGTVSCRYLYAPITASGKKNIRLRFDGSTLKYWVEKPTATYLITHIWVEDPFNQFKVAIPKSFPQLERAGIIMNTASNKYGYYSKAMIGSNASGFVSDVFNYEVGRKYPKWKYSSKSPLVIVDGKVLRNFSGYDMSKINTTTYAMNKDGYFISYVLTTDKKKDNQENAKKVIASGARYTFAFGPTLIKNGKIKPGLSNLPDARQAICQIDKNNFVIVTNTVGINNRSRGLGYKSLASLMYGMGCQNAFNTDGGGSINLIYKNRNTNTYSGIVTSSRDIADILYFVEK